jgi:hypothetical protein
VGCIDVCNNIPNARLTLARLLATILLWQVVPFRGTDSEAAALFTISSCMVNDQFNTSSRKVHQCVPISVHIDTNWHDEFTHRLCIVYALPALARRVCANLCNSDGIVLTWASPTCCSCDLLVKCSWQCLAWRTLALILPHRPDYFMNSLHIVNDQVATFCCDQNFDHFKILVPTWHTVTTGLCTRQVFALAGVVPIRATNSCKCQPCLRVLQFCNAPL